MQSQYLKRLVAFLRWEKMQLSEVIKVGDGGEARPKKDRIERALRAKSKVDLYMDFYLHQMEKIGTNVQISRRNEEHATTFRILHK